MNIQKLYLLGLLAISNFTSSMASTRHLILMPGVGLIAEEQDNDNAFFKSIRNGDIPTFRRFIEAGESVLQLNNFGCNPLYIAATHKQALMCNILLYKGADLFMINNHKSSAFEAAIKSEDENIREVFRNYILEMHGHECDARYESHELIKSIVDTKWSIWNMFKLKFDDLLPAHIEQPLIRKYNEEKNMYFYTSDNSEEINLINEILNRRINEQYGDMLHIALLFALREKNYNAVLRLMEYNAHNNLHNLHI